jgi:hypothetical protein
MTQPLKDCHNRFVARVLCLAFACLPASAHIVLKINDAPPVTTAAEDLAQLPQHTAVLNDHGKQISHEGVLAVCVAASLPCLVNARHVKNVPGRRTEVSNCQWLQFLLTPLENLWMNSLARR